MFYLWTVNHRSLEYGSFAGERVDGFSKIIEQRIQDAQRRGVFDDLPGAGKPIDLDRDACVPEDLRMAYKILKNAGCLPPEVEVKKEIANMEQLMAGMEDTREKYKAMKKLNHLITKLNLMRSGSLEFDVPECYEHKLVEKFGKK
ncbi:protein of unknown function [Desulfatibacillum alkenivorans DSM 16219]|jgi:hypothetical protein|uniref:DnaJ homologue subfamily C member 28 conserved domain-containing protein n=1 Tax=Desulfatibacillum alkenivorans DSM 16219 TaxID=1121393 RepID=A0A1M6DN97_9BACT|nr:protein of unknown function [Desulfatibacillum alkenivorans DSM 16219]